MLQEPRPPITVCQALTGSGRSAIAVIEVRGPTGWIAIKQCVQFSSDGNLEPGQVRYGHWTGPEQAGSTADGESVVVSPSDGDAIEVHCHGGAAAIRRILEDLQRVGVTTATAQQAPPRHLLRDESLSALGQCTTERMAAVALDQVRGALTDWIESWSQRIKSASGETATLLQLLAELRTEAERQSEWGAIGVRLGIPFRVVLVGAPNVGKSTLMNQLVGWNRSITYDEPGTTRDVLHASTVLDGLPIRLTDTAGIRTSDEAIEREGIRRSESEIRSADVVITVTDQLTTDSENYPAAIAEELQTLPANRWLQVLNKSDRLSPAAQIEANQNLSLLQTIATTGQGITQLQQRIVSSIAASLPPSQSPVPISPRQLQLTKQLAAATSAEEATLLLQSFSGDFGRDRA